MTPKPSPLSVRMRAELDAMLAANKGKPIRMPKPNLFEKDAEECLTDDPS